MKRIPLLAAIVLGVAMIALLVGAAASIEATVASPAGAQPARITSMNTPF